jgi:hypothetical protein
VNAQTKIDASLASAMAVAFGEIEGATKSANNPHFKSKYADLTAVIDAIKPALINHGLFFTQHPKPSDKGVIVETVLHHSGGEHLSLGELFVPANKQDAQGFGSALTSLICDAYKVESLPELTAQQGEAVISRLNDKLAEMVRAETAAKAQEAE